MRTNDELVDYLKGTGALYDEAVEEAMRRVDRIAFVPQRYRSHAYEDRALPNLLGQTTSQPTMVALMLQHLAASAGMKALEVGAGTGYVAAILSELVGPEGEVHAIERIPAIAHEAQKRLVAYSNVYVHIGNGITGLKGKAPFDRIIVSAAAENPPQALIDQLSGSGKIVMPVGHSNMQRLTLVEKLAGSVRKTDLGINCVFVPLIY